MRPDLADRQDQILSDLLVGGRGREPVPALVRATEGREYATLGG